MQVQYDEICTLLSFAAKTREPSEEERYRPLRANWREMEHGRGEYLCFAVGWLQMGSNAILAHPSCVT